MKKIILLLVVATFAFTSCKKEDVKPNEPTPFVNTTPTQTTIYFHGEFSGVNNSDAPLIRIKQNSIEIAGGNTSWCNSPANIYSYTFTINEVYNITFKEGATTVFVSDFKFTDAFGTYELSNIDPNNTGTLTTCNGSLSQKLVVY